MSIVVQDTEAGEQPQPEPTIPVLVARVKIALTRLLRWVRPTEAGKIRETVDELASAFADLLETVLRQAHLQSAGAFAPLLDRLDELEARIAALEGPEGTTREVGGGDT